MELGWVSFTILALLRSLAEYSRSKDLNTMEEAARAAAISAETSEPGNFLLTAYGVLVVSMSSGLSQQLWSAYGSPTWAKTKPGMLVALRK